jgi:hypothetical protein
LGVLGTQETFCIVIAGLFERDRFDLFLPEFDKPWVIHLRETCCYSTNLCTWRPNTVYKNKSVCRHHRASRSSFLYGIGPINRVRGCAMERKEGKNQRGGQGRRTTSESTKDAVGVCELRWRNFVAWQRFWFGKKGRRQRKGWGLYRGGWHGEGARVSSGAT